MSYQDTLKPFRMSDQIRLYQFSPNKMSEERARQFIGSSLAFAVWRMIEPTIQGKIDLTDLIEECYPDYLGAAIALNCEKEMFNSLGTLAQDAPRYVVVADRFGECYKT